MVGEAVGRRRIRALAVALSVVACALAVPAVASAEEFVVDSTADEADSAPGVGCLVAIEECTLRAAIEAANASEGEFDVIGFDEAVFDGQPAPSKEPAVKLANSTKPLAA
jgi:CSLREA domain-containing protein